MSKFFKALQQAERDRAIGAPTAARTIVESLPSLDVPVSLAPPLPPDEVEGVDEHLVSLVTPAAFEAEQYRALRHAVEMRHKRDGLTIVAVTSATIGDGKTTTAVNLAGALAQAPEARVLLIDADFRRPAMGQALGLRASGEPGLAHAIVQPSVGLEQIILPRPPFNLSVIPAGQTLLGPYEMLKSPRLGELLENARARFDYVILDAPPLVPVQDCRLIGRWVDGFLLVVAAHRTPRRLVEEALNVIESARMLGLVFNGDDQPPSGYSSGYYAAYHHDQGASANGNGVGRWRRVMGRVGSLRRRTERT